MKSGFSVLSSQEENPFLLIIGRDTCGALFVVIRFKIMNGSAWKFHLVAFG